MKLISARTAIIESYSIFRMQKELAGDSDLYSKPKTNIRRLNKKRKYTYLSEDGKRKTGYMPAITLGASETPPGRTSTTYRVANLTEAGHIISAAESDHEKRWLQINWGWFAYHCDDNHQNCINVLEYYVLELYLRSLSKRPNKKKEIHQLLVGLALLDQRSRVNNGRPLFSGAEVARRIGVKDANYHTRWKKHYEGIGSLIDQIDRAFLLPISAVINDMVKEPRNDQVFPDICKRECFST